MYIVAGIEQSDIQKIKPKMIAKATSIFDQSKTYTASVKEIKRSINPKTQFVDVILTLHPSKSTNLLLGEKFKIDIITNQIETFAVPRNAVLSDQNGSYIFIVKNNVAKKIYVKTGIEYKGVVAIYGNFKEGDKVVVSGNYVLKDDMRVREE